MSIVIVVNIITSIGIILGGFCMKQYSKSTDDHSIGFRTKRAMASKSAWKYANQNCGILWIVIGLISLILTIAALFFIQSERIETVFQSIILIFLIVAAIMSSIIIEKKLKSMDINH